MSNETKLEIKACKRWRRRLVLTQRKDMLNVRLMPARSNGFDTLAFHVESLAECSVMFDPPGVDEATLVVGACGFQIYVPRKAGELIVKTFSLRHWTRDDAQANTP